MTPGKHTPPGDRSFAVSVLTHVAAGVALVAAVAAAFWGLGQMRAPAGDPVIGEPPVATPEEEAELAEPDESDEPTEADQPDDPDESDEPDEPEETEEPSEPAHEPSTISVQVLDAAGDDGTRARVAEDRLERDGYDLCCLNPAVRIYERTTVFYTPGHEEKARQVATEYGYEIVEEKPDTLSSSVDVHIVVGEDHPTG